MPYSSYIISILSGFVIGTILIINPSGAFSGHEIVQTLINDNSSIAIAMIFMIIALRMIATTFSLQANAVGGLFLPLMSIGALVGYGFGELAAEYFVVEPFYFAAVGASVFMGVIMKLPLTAVVLALEISYDYNIVVPTAVSVAFVTYLVSFHFDIKKLKFHQS